jgi:hypothetical protein
MAKKQNKVVQLAEFREPNRADHGERTSEEARGTTFGPETLRRTRRGGGQSGRHWTFKGWTAPSLFWRR